ncbi:MAG: tripartite tricarboxylate transporter permease [Candidatus Nanoarchaeia archaeon]|nr:tripartite tricarboxylate transporter permease [Candidatus Nanoarchaeia archaeon]
MIIELIIALILGIIIGIITGLIPGIHINLVSTFLLSISPILLTIFPAIALVIFIVSLSITHTFIDFIPSIYLGAPNEDNFLSVLPGHKLLLQGQGHKAIILTSLGCLSGVLLLLILAPLFTITLPIIYPYIQRIMYIILILASLFLIITEKGMNKKILALFIFILSGFLGLAVLHNPIIKEPLLPLLTGLFGVSSLIISIKQKTIIPNQQINNFNNIGFSKISFLKTMFASMISSPLPSFLPGMGSSQAALIGTEIQGESNEKEFLFLVSSINLIVMGFSFLALYAINKTRTGSAVAIQKLIPNLSLNNLLLILTTITLTGIFAFFISIKISKIFAKNINRINYSKISVIILITLTLVSFVFSGWLGLLVLIISASLGIFAILTGVKRIILMGCLLIPTILFYIL